MTVDLNKVNILCWKIKMGDYLILIFFSGPKSLHCLYVKAFTRQQLCNFSFYLCDLWYFVTKIVLRKKKCSSDREKLLKFEAEGRELARNFEITM